MAPRANWKGFLRLSLVTCPVALYPATSDSEKINFNQINRNTGHRIKYTRVDADTGEEVASEDIMKGFKVDTDTYVEVTKEELENLARYGRFARRYCMVVLIAGFAFQLCRKWGEMDLNVGDLAAFLIPHAAAARALNEAKAT